MSDGLVPPLNAPPGITPAPGVQPGSTSQIVRARLVLVFGPTGAVNGVFVYPVGTTPAAGNGPVSSMTQSTVDPYGNPTVPGDASYQYLAGAPIAAVSLNNGQVIFYNWSGTAWVADGQVSAGQMSSNTGAPMNIEANGQGVVFPLDPITSTFGTTAKPTLITTDSWTAATAFGSGWAASGSGVNGVFFRLESDGNIHWIADVHTTNGAPSTTICTIPAAYVPGTSVVCAGPLVPTAGGAAYVTEALTPSTFAVAGVPAANGVRYAGGGWYPPAEP
jgi:hypothetical protein